MVLTSVKCQAYSTIFLKGFPTLSEKWRAVTQALFLSFQFVLSSLYQYICRLFRALNGNKKMFATTHV